MNSFTYVGSNLRPSNTSQLTVNVGSVLDSFSKTHVPSLPLLKTDIATSPIIFGTFMSSNTGGRVERLHRRGINLSFTDAKKLALFPIKLRAARAEVVFPSLLVPHETGIGQYLSSLIIIS